MNHIFITGASGCVGHYVTEQLLAADGWHLHLLLRPNSRLKWDPTSHSNVTVHVGNMDSIDALSDVIFSMDYIMHIFTDWSDSEYATLLNVTKTHALFNMVNPERIKRIVYFSTASILGPGNTPIPEAGRYGPGYVRSKYNGYRLLQDHPMRDKIITLFPTLVFGGDNHHPYSHISAGIMPNRHYLKMLRFIYIDSAFHFIHSFDIAQCAIATLTMEHPNSQYVLGNRWLSGRDAIKRLCQFFKIPVYFSIKVPIPMVFLLAKLLRITIAPWETYCLRHPHFRYNVVDPSTFGLTPKFPTLETLLEDIAATHG